MSLQDLEVKGEYRSLIDDMSKDFYLPLLNEAILYKRAVGFFSSSSLIEISKGIDGLIKNGGKIKLVASPRLSDEDIEAITKGYKLRDEVLQEVILRDLYEPTSNFEKDKLNLLANLISNNILDIKIALLEKDGGYGMFHEKMGIIEDDYSNKVAFSGSMNESATAMNINYESIDVFRSWSNSSEIREKVINKEEAFDSIWNDEEPNIRIIHFLDLKQVIISKYQKTKLISDFHNGEIHLIPDAKKYKLSNGARIKENISLYDYQVKAINEWENQNYRGIFDMATGTGKTFAGLGAVAILSEKLNDNLAVIIVCPFQHLVEQWIEDTDQFNISPIVGYSSSSQKDWKKRLDVAIRNQKLGVKDSEFFTLICTNATFKSEYVQEQISKIRGDILLMVDEAHNFGSEGLSSLLDNRFKYRLALSATFERHNDEEGTQKLYNFFGEKCIEYSLEQAIDEEKLTPYRYYPIVVHLTEEERDLYSDLSYEMSRNLMTGKNGKVKLNKFGEILAIKRARIVAGANEKIDMLRKQILKHRDENYILVYCGATNVFDPDKDYSSVDDSDLRQIDAVTELLGDEFKMKVSQFTSKENILQRKILKEKFEQGKQLQALIAIKCLDEGVNIPNIKTAFILASTTNPKEYIQRRGRVLRKAEDKEFAEIYDFITLPRALDEVSSLTKEEMKRDISLVRNEITRVIEFGRISMNRIDSQHLVWNIKEAYGIDELELSFI